MFLELHKNSFSSTIPRGTPFPVFFLQKLHKRPELKAISNAYCLLRTRINPTKLTLTTNRKR